LGDLARCQGDYAQGAQLLSAAEALHEASGTAWWPADRIEFECNLALLHQALGQAQFAAVWAKGTRLLSDGIEAVVACALHAMD
jgi:hypothetical protein